MTPRFAAVSARRLRQERGQTSAEYVGIVVVVAAIVLALSTAGIGDRLADTLEQIAALAGDQPPAGGGSGPGVRAPRPALPRRLRCEERADGRHRPGVEPHGSELEGTVGSVITDLARVAGIPLQEAGGLRLVAADHAAAFLDACLRANTRVVGIEGFRLLDGAVQPDMSAIADLSELDEPAESVAEARIFLEAASRPDLAFDFVLE